jgi:hypothetical protein
MKKRTKASSLLGAIVLAAALSACEEPNQGPAEKVGEKIDDAAKKTGEAMEDAGEKMKDAVD